jgi:hypothetical protein
LVLVCIFLAAGTLTALHPMVLSGFVLIQTDLTDTRFNNYILEHSFRWVQGDPRHGSFWDPPFFYPAPNTNAYGDILLGSAPIYWLLRVLGLHYDSAFQGWMVTVLALNFLAALLLLQRGLKFSLLPSLAGSFLFAYGSIRIAQLSHQQLLPQFFSLLAIFALIRLFQAEAEPGSPPTRGGSGWVFLFFASLVLQVYAGFYLGWFLAFGLAVSLVFVCLIPPCRRSLGRLLLRHWPGGLATLALSCLALVWFVLHYSQACQEVGGRPWWEVKSMLPRLKSWLNLGPENWLYAYIFPSFDFSTLPMEHEHRIGLGFITAILCLMGLWQLRRTPWGRVAGLSFLVIFGSSLFWLGWSPWRLIHHYVPGGAAIRGVTRISLLLLIPLSLGLTAALERFKVHSGLVILCILIVMAEQVQTTHYYDKLADRQRVAALAAQVPQDARAFFYAHFSGPGYLTKEIHCLDAMWAQMLAGVPTVNGYSGWSPKGWEKEFRAEVKSFSETPALKIRLQNWLMTSGKEDDAIVVIPVDKGVILSLELPKTQ